MRALISLLAWLFLIHQGHAVPTRAMWVYKTDVILHSQDEQTKLFSFCEQRHITELFWQMHLVSPGKDDHFVIRDAETLRPFLQAATRHGLRLHALCGDPAHALTQNHSRVLARVDALLAFNDASAEAGRFAGMHLDIEPHGLPEWKRSSNAEKAAMLTQLVEVNGKIVDKLKAAKSPLLLGADITFWFNKTKADGSPVYPVTFRGKTTDATTHLLGLLDNVGIMGYRGKAGGRGGLIDIARRTVESADKLPARAFVGVKMADIGPKLETFFGNSEEAMMTQLHLVDEAFASHRGYAGIAFFMYEAFREMPRTK